MSTKKGVRKSDLNKFLNSHLKALEEAFQMLDKPAESSLEKVEWSEVIKIGGQISKQATIIGMLWNGEPRKLKDLKESITEYFNLLNQFILLCYGSTVCAGRMLHALIGYFAKQVIDCSRSLLTEAVSSYGSSTLSQTSELPQLVSSVLKICTELKTMTNTNCIVVGRLITQHAGVIKNVIVELNYTKDTTSLLNANLVDEQDELYTEELIVEILIEMASSLVDAIKEVLRFITGLIKSPNIDTKDSIDSLERIFEACRRLMNPVRELSRCSYPPRIIIRRVSEMRTASKKIADRISELRGLAENLGSSTEVLFAAFEQVEMHLGRLESVFTGDLVPEMLKLAL